jgi:hypothetical protein
MVLSNRTNRTKHSATPHSSEVGKVTTLFKGKWYYLIMEKEISCPRCGEKRWQKTGKMLICHCCYFEIPNGEK